MSFFCHKQALSEGWDLFDLEGRISLQRIDCPEDNPKFFGYSEPKFMSDAHAIVDVAIKAQAGSEYHWSALHLIATLSENLIVLDLPNKFES